jgi:Major Facilitator Superfamily
MTASGRSLTTIMGIRSFWIVVAALLAMMAAAGAPSPLYVVYEQRIGFSAITLTVIFSVYVVALLVTLLTVGSLSDHVGRKPVLATAFVLEIVSLALFLPADSVAWLMVARVVQGIATGTALGALGAALVDTEPPGSGRGTLMNSVLPALGLAVGALGAGVLLEYAPSPTSVVFWVLIALMAVTLVALLSMPESAPRRPGALASLRPDLRVPAEVRPAFLAGLPIFVATWAVGGIYLSLGGSLAAGVFGLRNHVVGGLVVAALTLSGALASYLLRAAPPRRSTWLGSFALVLGLVLALVGIATRSPALFFLGSVVTGFGFGGSYLGALRAVMTTVPATSRAATLSAVLTVSYLAFSGPAILAGWAATRVGLRDAAVGYAIAVIGVTLAAMAIQLVRRSPAVAATPTRSG